MKILEGHEKEYKDWYDKNSDGYGRACFTYAERWAEMLENKIESSTEDVMKVIVDNADKLSHEADTEGITDICMDVQLVFFHSVGSMENILESGTIRNITMMVMVL